MSFAPRKSNPNTSMSRSNSFKASHPSTPKPSSKNMVKSQSISKTPDVNDPLIKRIALLEDVVSNLQLQHDTFLPLLQIVDRVGDVLNLEEQATYFINSASELEILISRQNQNAKESFENTENIIMPSSVAEGTGFSCRSLPEMQTSLADIEASIHSMLAKRKVNLKKQEVQCKEELLKIMQEIDVDLQDVKKEVIELQSALVSSGFKEFDVLDVKDQEIRSRVRTGMRQIEIALEEHALYGGKGGDNWLLEELSHRVDDAIKELNDYLEYKYRQLDINFKQEFMSLKSQFEKVREETIQIEAIKNAVVKPSKEIAQLSDKNKKNLGILENILKIEFNMIEDISINLNENLVDLNEKARNLIKDLKSAGEYEKIKIFASAKVDFDQMLKGSWAEINTLQETLENCNTSCRAELLRLEENINRIETLKRTLEASGSKIRCEDFKPKQTAIRTKIEEKQQFMNNEIEDLQKRLMGLWKGLNHEAQLGIEFIPKKPEQQALFEQAEEKIA
ncbi:hypothetical protein SteCoe_29106 [Stentor coeruleus]|uniref:Uncharacterized protein n=1 Tax=Stentor coeruleus TaxID=5963 RepID=A0A1R2B761_9CILI|nr:hypothetical protein SteCoe_29106 [Stentor coeruleus]